MGFCLICGNETEGDEEFCRDCEAKLGVPSPTISIVDEGELLPITEPVPPEEKVEVPRRVRKVKKSRKPRAPAKKKIRELEKEIREKLEKEFEEREQQLRRTLEEEAERREASLKSKLAEVEAELRRMNENLESSSVKVAEMKKVLKIMDDLLEKLPEDVIEEFAQSEDFKIYERILDEFGI
jgi:chromosome segregation ATPase